MLAKLIVWDRTREAAVERMLLALSQMHVVGVGQNIAFLSRLIDHPLFRSGQVDTGLIEREREVLLPPQVEVRSEEHTSELQSLMRISYAVFCLKKKKNKYTKQQQKTL